MTVPAHYYLIKELYSLSSQTVAFKRCSLRAQARYCSVVSNGKWDNSVQFDRESPSGAWIFLERTDPVIIGISKMAAVPWVSIDFITSTHWAIPNLNWPLTDRVSLKPPILLTCLDSYFSACCPVTPFYSENQTLPSAPGCSSGYAPDCYCCCYAAAL